MNWSSRSPRVYRFLAKTFVDEFFTTGRLRLSSFARFRKHTDEQRLDVNEGTISILCRTDNSSSEPILVQAIVGADAYVLSASLAPSGDVMRAFEADSAIVIRDPVGFAQAIGRALPAFRFGFDGPCSYQSRRFVYADLSKLNAGSEALQAFVTDSSDPDYQVRMGELIGTVAGKDAYFLKHHDYISQNEWRFVWVVERVTDDVIFVTAPDARQYCEPWGSSTVFVAFKGKVPLPPAEE